MSSQVVASSHSALEVSARRHREREAFALPAARWPYRIAGGAIAAACGLVLWLKLQTLLRGEIGLLELLQADYGLLIFALIFGLSLTFIALTGKMPRAVWKQLQRSTGSAD